MLGTDTRGQRVDMRNYTADLEFGDILIAYLCLPGFFISYNIRTKVDQILQNKLSQTLYINKH